MILSQYGIRNQRGYFEMTDTFRRGTANGYRYYISNDIEFFWQQETGRFATTIESIALIMGTTVFQVKEAIIEVATRHPARILVDIAGIPEINNGKRKKVVFDDGIGLIAQQLNTNCFASRPGRKKYKEKTEHTTKNAIVSILKLGFKYVALLHVAPDIIIKTSYLEDL